MSRELTSLAAITAVGARSAIGLDALQTGMLFRAGFAAMAPAPLGPDGADVTVCQQIALEPSLVGSDRLAALAIPALDEALAGLELAAGARVQLSLALDPHEVEPDVLAAQLLERVRRRSAAARLEVMARGEGGATLLLGKAAAALAANKTDVVILGGAHSDYDAARIAALAAADRLYSDDNIDAVLPGEAAAFVVLSRRPSKALGQVYGIGNGRAEGRFDNDTPTALARGATAAVRQAVSCLSDGARAGWVLSDMAFERWRMREWISVLVRIADVLATPYRLDNPCHRVGALGAAAVPLCMALACEGWARNWAPGEVALVMAGSDSGERGALVMGNARAVPDQSK